ncbi:MAG: DUF922 domain-containing protein [Bacteroidota bacterium]
MKTNVFLFATLICFFFLKSNIADDDDGKIKWSQDYLLKWTDFKGKPDSASKSHALTTVNNSIDYKLTSDTLYVQINCQFIKKESWLKTTPTENLLTHEQRHFDISELSCRKLRQKISNYKVSNLNKANLDLNDSFNEMMTECDQLNKKYDLETQHGTIFEKQKEWNAKIKKELEELNSFSSSTIAIAR